MRGRPRGVRHLIRSRQQRAAERIGPLRVCQRTLATPRILSPAPEGRESIIMNRNNTLYFIVGALVVGLIVVGYFVYQDRNSGVSIEIGEQGMSVDGR